MSERYRVTASYTTEGIPNTSIFAARHTATFDVECKSVLHVAQVALKTLREKHPAAKMTGFTCERLDDTGKPKHPHSDLIRQLTDSDKAAIQDCAWNGKIYASSVHWKVLDRLGFHKLIHQSAPGNGKIAFFFTDLGREIAAELGYTAGGAK